jgi:hypothetical protein
VSDERLRLLSRADGLRERAQVLLERVRLGQQTHERLEWAARLGHEDALAAVGKLERPAIDWSSWWDREYAIRGVAEAVGGLGYKRAVVSFAADCAEQVLPVFESRFPGDDRPRKAVQAARAWVAAATPETVRAAARAAKDAERAGRAITTAFEVLAETRARALERAAGVERAHAVEQAARAVERDAATGSHTTAAAELCQAVERAEAAERAAEDAFRAADPDAPRPVDPADEAARAAASAADHAAYAATTEGEELAETASTAASGADDAAEAGGDPEWLRLRL